MEYGTPVNAKNGADVELPFPFSVLSQDAISTDLTVSQSPACGSAPK